MNGKNARWRNPSELLALDETLYPYRGTIGFKQYNLSKPTKYGPLYGSLCNSLLYAGKTEVTEGLVSKYYVTRTDEYTKYLFNEISKHNSIEGSNILLDQYFTSVSLAERILEKKIAGSMCHDRKGISKELKELKSFEEKYAIFMQSYKNNIMLVSCIDKKKPGEKNVIVLTTMHDTVKVTNDERKTSSVHDV